MKDKVRLDKTLTIAQMVDEAIQRHPELDGKLNTLALSRYINSLDDWNYTAERFNYLKDLVDSMYKSLEAEGQQPTAEIVSEKIGMKHLSSELVGFLHNHERRDIARMKKKRSGKNNKAETQGNVKSTDEQALKEIIDLYLPKGRKTFDCDMTYGEGLFYKHLPKPKEKYDEYPKSDDVHPLSTLKTEKISKGYASIIIDLPDLVLIPTKKKTQDDNKKGAVKPEDRKAYKAFHSLNELYKTYSEMIGLARLHLAPNGILVFKAPDTLIRDNEWDEMWTADYAIDEAVSDFGLELVDEIILVEDDEAFPNGTNLMTLTRHGKRFHVFLIFKKPDLWD